jgi:hypothetical protein
MLRWDRYVFLSFCLSILPAGLAADGPGTWIVSRFAADGAALNKAASAVNPKPGTNVVVLDEEDSYVFDADGKTVHTHYLAYKILTQKGAEGWDTISLSWEPWHEERPSVRARVVTPDNVIHLLDPKTVTDAPARDEDDKTFGDGRVLRAPLPAIALGSVVEEEEISKARAFLRGGSCRTLLFCRQYSHTTNKACFGRA